MEQLDAVYSALTNLEKNYGRSKKTREEYLLEKCGGDFDVGPFLILNALSGEELTDPEDIHKLSVVREILGKIQETRGRHNSLRSFNFEEDGNIDLLINALNAGQNSGTHIVSLSQEVLWDTKGRNTHELHYRCDAEHAYVAPIEKVRYYSVFSPAMAMFVGHIAQMAEQPQLGSLYERKLGDRVVPARAVDFN